MAKKESNPSSASKPDESPGATKSFDPQAIRKDRFQIVNKCEFQITSNTRIKKSN